MLDTITVLSSINHNMQAIYHNEYLLQLISEDELLRSCAIVIVGNGHLCGIR